MSLTENQTLESLCLEIIICNFDNFCAAFLSEKNNLNSYVEFIQRRWSSEILKKLFQRCLLKDEHLQIVLNKYTKELDFQNILHCGVKALINRLKEIGNVIKLISMKEMPVFYNFDNMWSYLCNVQTIELQRTNCSNQSLYIISENCPFLKNINLFGCCKINDGGMSHFIKHKIPLEQLNVEETSVTYKGVAAVLKNVTSIRKLWHSNVPKAILEVLGLNDSLEKPSNGTVFNLNNIVILNNAFRPETHMISILKVCQSACPHINDLTVFEIVTEEQLASCSLFPNLNVINLQCSLVSKHELCIDKFLKLRGETIHTLSLSLFSLSFEVLLNSCQNLKCLTLEFPNFITAPKNLKPGVNFLHLKIFNLHSFLITEENTKSISCLISLSPNLVEINMRHCEMNSEISDIILNSPKNLKALNFSSTTVQASFLEEVLRTHKELNVLRIDNSGITSDEYDDLMDLVDNMENKVQVLWADYTEAIKQLYSTDTNSLFHVMKRQVMKL